MRNAAAMTTGGRLWTTGQVAGKYGLHLRKVQRAAESGALPYSIKLPGSRGRYLFEPAVVEMWARQIGLIELAEARAS